MSRLKKLNAFFITLIFSHTATAVIVEGSVSGKAAELYSLSLTQDQVQTDGVNHTYQQAATYDAKGSSYNIVSLASQTPSLQTGGLAQNLSLLPSSNVHDNVVSYAGLESVGVASRADYHGWVAVNLNATKVDANEAVTVPEPSSLLLLLGPLLFLLWRMDVLSGISRKNR